MASIDAEQVDQVEIKTEKPDDDCTIKQEHVQVEPEFPSVTAQEPIERKENVAVDPNGGVPVESINITNSIDIKVSYGCDICQQSFQTPGRLTKHNLMKHPKGQPLECSKCNKTFAKICHLTNHERTHEAKEEHSCEICGKSFPNESKLKLHFIAHYNGKTFECSFCPRTFNQQNDLEDHEKLHSTETEKPYKCNFCELTFAHASIIMAHVKRTHLKEKPFQCKFCSKTFAVHYYLIEHERIHTGERPFQCQFCNKSFARKSNLKTHERTHSGVKPFQCDFCNHSFLQKANMVRHMEIVHLNKGAQ